MANGNQGERQVSGFCQGNIDVSQNLQGTRAFHLSRLDQFLRNGFEGLSQKENRKSRCKVGQPDTKECVDKAQCRQGLVIANNQNLRHHHQLHEH